MNRAMPAVMSVCILVAISLSAIKADAAENVSAAAGVELNSSYIYRGVVYNDGLVLQPWMDTYIGPFTVGFWGNMDLDDYDGTMQKRRFSEIDLMLTYAFEVAGLNVSIAVAEYLFPNVADGEGGALPGTRELILKAGRPLFWGFALETKFSYDFDMYDDLYAALKLSYGYSLTEKLSFSAHGLGSYAGNRLTVTGKSGANEYDLRGGLAYALTEMVEIGAMGGYTGTLDSDVLPDPAENGYGGISVIASF